MNGIPMLMKIDIKADYSNGIRTKQSNHWAMEEYVLRLFEGKQPNAGNQKIERASMIPGVWRFPKMEVARNTPSHEETLTQVHRVSGKARPQMVIKHQAMCGDFSCRRYVETCGNLVVQS